MSTRRDKLLSDFEDLKIEYSDPSSLIQGLELDDESIYFTYEDQNYVLQVSSYPEYCDLHPPEGGDPFVKQGTLLEILRGIVSGEESMVYEENPYAVYGNPEFGATGGSGEEHAEKYSHNPHFMLDVENFKILFGEENILLHSRPVLEQVEVNLLLPPLEVLDVGTAEAWGVNTRSPIIIRVPVSDSIYLETSKAPKIDVFQKDGEKKVKFGLKAQLESLLETFVNRWWPGKTGRKIQTKKISEEHKVVPSQLVQDDSKSKHPLVQTPKAKDDGAPIVNMDHIMSLVEMGFTESLAFNALILTKGNFQEATDILLASPESCYDVEIPKPQSPTKAPSGKSSKAQKHIGGIRKDKVDTLDLFIDPQKSLKDLSEDEKLYVNSDYGFFVMVMAYVRKRLPNMNDYCVICDRPHVFATGNMLKPAVCSRELCCWSFQQLGVGSEAASDIATEAEVVDLLVCFATIAAKSPRKELIFNPFPTVFNPNNRDVKVLDEKNKDFTLVTQLLTNMPSVEQMTQAADFSSMKESLDRAHPLCFPLLQWIINSNRSHIVQLNEGKQIRSMVTKHQYLLLSAPPEKETLFRLLKGQHGSTFAFHGSSIENWHSILRRGLLNASGSSLQVNGAAYGARIYLSPSAAVSFGYSRMQKKW